METVWFWLVAVMIALYVVLDGFDLGAGILHLAVARTGEERRQVIRSIGPVWDGNEVWLIAGGGTLYFAFPLLYASAFSGFYLPLTIVLWLLILRGIGIEFRSHVASPVWRAAPATSPITRQNRRPIPICRNGKTSTGWSATSSAGSRRCWGRACRTIFWSGN